MDWKEKAEEGIIIFDSKTGYLYPEPDNQAPSMQANNRRWDNLNNISTCLFDVFFDVFLGTLINVLGMPPFLIYVLRSKTISTIYVATRYVI